MARTICQIKKEIPQKILPQDKATQILTILQYSIRITWIILVGLWIRLIIIWTLVGLQVRMLMLADLEAITTITPWTISWATIITIQLDLVMWISSIWTTRIRQGITQTSKTTKISWKYRNPSKILKGILTNRSSKKLHKKASMRCNYRTGMINTLRRSRNSIFSQGNKHNNNK